MMKECLTTNSAVEGSFGEDETSSLSSSESVAYSFEGLEIMDDRSKVEGDSKVEDGPDTAVAFGGQRASAEGQTSCSASLHV